MRHYSPSLTSTSPGITRQKWAESHRDEVARALSAVTNIPLDIQTVAANRSSFAVGPVTDDIVATVRAQGLRIVHVDTTVLMERPQVGPHRDAIRARLAGALGLDEHIPPMEPEDHLGLGA